ncbi:MAG: F0F1 ATP synthase subunit delta [Pseudoflavonifractor sp.]|nr:F0F1 ATP synthase subunit delta [Alloprevotella sp.]MCM1117587.1 F0F1 ATP synthase subunit delta [Pseudoflavonifractor sp.]
MNEGLIPRRYAKALLAFAREKGADSRVYDIMRQLAASFDAQPELQAAVSNPFVKTADKVSLVNTAAGLADDADPVFDDFLSLLVQRERISFIRAIALAYIALYRHDNDIYDVKVTGAAPLDSSELSRLRTLVGRHLGPEAKMEFSSAVDPSLIGGFTISVGNERLDASVANEFKRLRQRMELDS